MYRVLSTEAAVFLELHPPGNILSIFGSGIITAFAFITR
jgi:hypothetical protein